MPEKERAYFKPSAKSRALKMLARRDHSLLEIKQKLVDLEYTTDEIVEAITWIKDKGWIKPDHELAEIFARMLERKGKSQAYINNYLKKKGLPKFKIDEESEVSKAFEIAQRLMTRESKKNSGFTRESQAKIGRKLLTRGFSGEVVRKVIYEKLRNQK